MKTSLKQKQTISARVAKQRLALAAVGIGLIGALVVLITRAATTSVPLEAELAAITGNARAIEDPAASGGKALYFGQASPNPNPGGGSTGGYKFPLKISANKHYFEDQNGKPFFYAADTCWSCLSYLSLDDAKKLIDIRKSQGFTAIQTVLVPLGKTTTDRVRAQPFAGEDVTQPNEAYWTVVDQIVQYAGDQGMVLWILPLWMSSYDGDGARPLPSDSATQTYYTWVGNRYKSQPHILWAIGGDDETNVNVSFKNAAGNALKAADPIHPITYHPTYDDYGLSGQPWHDFNSIQWNDISPPYPYTHIREGYERSPAKPILDAEPPYDPNTAMQTGDATTPLINRKNGWWAALSGALGITYGGPADAWKPNKEGPINWDAINRDQAKQSACVAKTLSPLPWHRLVSDWDNQTVGGDRGTYTSKAQKGSADPNYVTAGRADDGSLIVAYAPTSKNLTVDLSKLSGPGTAQWLDPVSCSASGAPQSVTNSGQQSFQTPGNNSGGDKDWVLIIKKS